MSSVSVQEVAVFSEIEEAIRRFAEGSFLVVMDDEDRENEGDLILSAQFATAEKVAFAIRHTSGIICAPLTAPLATKLALHPMTRQNTDPNQTAFTVSIDHADCATGVSAADRSLTFRSLVEPNVTSAQFRRPGHVFPLVAKSGGVRERRGHTEVTLDFCRLARLPMVGLLAELTNDDGTMMRLKDCAAFAKQHSLPLVNIQQVVSYLEQKEGSVDIKKSLLGLQLEASCQLPIQKQQKFLGNWEMRTYSSYKIQGHQIVLIKNPEQVLNTSSDKGVLVRLHSECFTGNTIGSLRCDCEDQLDQALIKINEEGRGVVIYLQGHEGRGIGLSNKVKAYSLQDQHQLDTFAANEALGLPKDARTYDVAVEILRELGISNVRLLSNNKFKVEQLSKHGLTVTRTPLRGKTTDFNSNYLKAKRLEQEENYDDDQIEAKAQKENPDEKAHSKQIPIALPTPSNLSKIRVGIVKTSWNASLVDLLANQTKDNLLSSGILPSNLFETVVPGSFEVPWAAQLLLSQVHPPLDAILCFGVLIKGETKHFEYISSSVSQAITKLQMKTGVPVIYGILNCLTLEQAEARCGTKSQLPLSLAATAIHMAGLRRGFLPLAISSEEKSPTVITSSLSTENVVSFHKALGSGGLFSGFPSVLTTQPCDLN
eukprot:TRINITY_DN6954_c0_g1_i1.p1 TRINITY_DN6954_c0_g1~~TRINITY_DN6954_c0_g1_i1.p1  ORF type:complete len:655 (+),score=148.42 TRINITY_DN6954_c0_g1_i1:159-2123(+)